MTNSVALISAFAGLVVMALAPRKNLRAGRIAYWTGAALTAASAYFVAQPQGWKSAVGALAFVGISAAFIAYAYTPFLVVKGRRTSFYSASPQPYGAGVTNKRSWWRLLVAMVVLAFGIISWFLGEGSPWIAALAAAGIVIAGAAFGYRDALLGAEIAQDQRLQLILASAITVGVFPVAYLSAYFLRRGQPSCSERYGRHAGPPNSDTGG